MGVQAGIFCRPPRFAATRRGPRPAMGRDALRKRVMTQTASANVNPITITAAGKLPGLPKGPLTPTQQLEALRRVQAQAEHRIKLGLQLFKAAEAHATHQQRVIQQIKAEQANLRERLETDVTKSLHSYDQWVGKIDESFTRAMQALEAKIQGLESEWNAAQERMTTMVRRCEALMDQSRYMLDEVKRQQATAAKAKMEVKRPESAAEPKLVATLEPLRTAAPPLPNAPQAPPVPVPKSAAPLTPDEPAAAEAESAPKVQIKPPVKVIRPPSPLAVQVEAVAPQPASGTAAGPEPADDDARPLSISPSMLDEAEEIAGDGTNAADTNANLDPPISYTDIINRFGGGD